MLALQPISHYAGALQAGVGRSQFHLPHSQSPSRHVSHSLHHAMRHALCALPPGRLALRAGGRNLTFLSLPSAIATSKLRRGGQSPNPWPRLLLYISSSHPPIFPAATSFQPSDFRFMPHAPCALRSAQPSHLPNFRGFYFSTSRKAQGQIQNRKIPPSRPSII